MMENYFSFPFENESNIHEILKLHDLWSNWCPVMFEGTSAHQTLKSLFLKIFNVLHSFCYLYQQLILCCSFTSADAL